MKFDLLVFSGVVAFGLGVHSLIAAPTFTTDTPENEGLFDDVFHVSVGNQVILSTPQAVDNGLTIPIAVFGGGGGTYMEPIHRFSDGAAPGTMDFVEGQTREWINLISFSLRLEQNTLNDPNGGVSSFALFGSRDGINVSQVSGGSIPSGARGIGAPLPAISATLVGGSVVRQENGPGPPDDAISFQVMIAGMNGGLAFEMISYPAVATTPVTSLTATPTLVTITLTPAPSHGITVVSFHDVSYPAVAAHVAIEVPPASETGAYVLGRRSLGQGLVNLLSDPGNTDPAWINYPGLRAVEMTNGGGGETKVFMSEEIDLSGIDRDIRFTGTLRAINRTGGFEEEDGFYASLVINSRTTYPIRLVGRYDRGSPGNGMMNGGSNPAYDEFNAAGTVTGPYVSIFALDATIPNWVQTVQLFVRGVNDSADETLIVEDVLFQIPSDTDGDGIPDHYEESGGLDKNTAADRDLDLDGDGQSNFREYIAGTASNDARSVLRITEVRMEGTIVTVTWNSVPEKLYLVEVGPDLSSWFQVGGDLPAAPYHATSTSTSLDLSLLGFVPSQYFLRIRVK